MSPKARINPLVSVVITCYNQGEYLSRAIESVLKQSHKNTEIIVIDDGSTDETKVVANSYPNINYVYQLNQGLSSARNKGIYNSKGEYIVFLDADDWLLPDALSINLKYLKQYKKAAFVSGGHLRVNRHREFIQNPTILVDKNHYCHLLEGNFIQMHGAVMYNRWVFEKFRFNVSLNSCEDYEMYLKIGRNYPFFHHTKPIAVYFIHEQSMSRNAAIILESALLVLNNQRKFLSNTDEKKCLRKGLNNIKNLYCRILFERILNEEDMEKNYGIETELFTLWKYHKLLYLKYLVLKPLPIMRIKSFIKKKHLVLQWAYFVNWD